MGSAELVYLDSDIQNDSLVPHAALGSQAISWSYLFVKLSCATRGSRGLIRSLWNLLGCGSDGNANAE